MIVIISSRNSAQPETLQDDIFQRDNRSGDMGSGPLRPIRKCRWRRMTLASQPEQRSQLKRILCFIRIRIASRISVAADPAVNRVVKKKKNNSRLQIGGVVELA